MRVQYLQYQLELIFCLHLLLKQHAKKENKKALADQPLSFCFKVFKFSHFCYKVWKEKVTKVTQTLPDPTNI